MINKKNLFKVIFCIMMVSTLNIAFSYQLSFLVDALINLDKNLFIRQIVIMLILIFLMLCFEFLSQYLNSVYLNDIGFKIHKTVISRILDKDLIEFNQDSKGVYVSQIENDIERVKNFHYGSQLSLFQGIFSLIIASIALISLDTITAGLVLISSILPVIIPYLFKNKLRERQNIMSQVQAGYTSNLSIMLSGFLEFKNLVSHSNLLKNISNKYKAINQEANITAKLSAMVNVLVGILFYSITMIILFFGGHRILAGYLTVGGLTAILSISEELVGPINKIADSLLSIHSVKDIRSRLEETFIESKTKSEDITFVVPDIAVINLSYEFGRKIFNNFSFNFKFGKKYLITGTSGHGKSTLANLMTKNIPMQAGDIYYGNVSINDLSYEQIQQLITYIPQKTTLINDSILNNLHLFHDFDVDMTLDLIRKFGLEERFPDRESLEEIITEDSNLSGGQKQRLVIIRGLLQVRPILIIDEGLSALDENTFELVEDYLINLPKITLIHISHRQNLEAKFLYDQIITISNP